MLIGELARRAEVSRDTVRFYEQSGLIFSGVRRAGSRFYREYSLEMLERLTLIRQAKSAGFSLREMKQIFERYGTEVDAILLDEQKQIISAKLIEIENRMQQLKEIKKILLAYLREISS